MSSGATTLTLTIEQDRTTLHIQGDGQPPARVLREAIEALYDELGRLRACPVHREEPVGGLYISRLERVQAFQLKAEHLESFEDWPDWALAAYQRGEITRGVTALRLHTSWGFMECALGWWVVNHEANGLLPLKPYPFSQRYEAVR